MPSQVFDGAEMRRRRQATGLTRTQLGARINRCAETIGFYELGLRTPQLGALCDICDVLGCRPNDLLVSAKKPARKRRAS